jgi:hypothetical protein
MRTTHLPFYGKIDVRTLSPLQTHATTAPQRRSIASTSPCPCPIPPFRRQNQARQGPWMQSNATSVRSARRETPRMAVDLKRRRRPVYDRLGHRIKTIVTITEAQLWTAKHSPTRTRAPPTRRCQRLAVLLRALLDAKGAGKSGQAASPASALSVSNRTQRTPTHRRIESARSSVMRANPPVCAASRLAAAAMATRPPRRAPRADRPGPCLIWTRPRR